MQNRYQFLKELAYNLIYSQIKLRINELFPRMKGAPEQVEKEASKERKMLPL